MRNRTKGILLSACVILAAACEGLLDVQDPQRYTSEDVDAALQAAADGVEGNFHSSIDQMAIYSALLSDEYQHTGTWAGYDDIDHGRFIFGTPDTDGTFNAFLRTRFFADDTEQRLIRVLGEAEAEASVMTPQVQTVSALADLYLGTYFCEAPAEASGPAVTDVQLLERAVEKFTRSLQTARSVQGAEKWETVSLAGRARANLLLGNHQAAAQDASSVPDGWSYDAIYTEARGDNSLVSLTTQGFNTAAGLREKWWGRVNVDAKAMEDPWTDEVDARLPVLFTGEFGVDGVTPHYSQWRFQARGSDISILTSEEMRLIEAEAAIRSGDLATGVGILNDLRAAAGLSDLPATTDQGTAMDYLLHERFAALFMTGMRMADLWRMDLTDDLLAQGDFKGSEDPRPVKFSMSDTEARDNPEISDRAADRCLPMSG